MGTYPAANAARGLLFDASGFRGASGRGVRVPSRPPLPRPPGKPGKRPWWQDERKNPLDARMNLKKILRGYAADYVVSQLLSTWTVRGADTINFDAWQLTCTRASPPCAFDDVGYFYQATLCTGIQNPTSPPANPVSPGVDDTTRTTVSHWGRFQACGLQSGYYVPLEGYKRKVGVKEAFLVPGTEQVTVPFVFPEEIPFTDENVNGDYKFVPSRDPWDLPINNPAPDGAPLPLKYPWYVPRPQVLPHIDPHPAPGPRPIPVGLVTLPSVVDEPGPSVGLQPTPSGGVKTYRPTNTRWPAPPGRGVKEAKMRLLVNYKFHMFVGGFTELVEVMDCLYASVPKAFRKAERVRSGRPPKQKARAPEKMRVIYNHFGSIDWPKFNKCFARNLVEDLTYGGAARLQAKALQKNPYYKRPVSPSFGSRYQPRYDGSAGKSYQWEDFWGGLGLHDVFY